MTRLIITILLLLQQSLSAQNPKKTYPQTEPTVENFNWFMNLSEVTKEDMSSALYLRVKYSHSSLDTAFLIAKKAIALTENESDEKLYARALFMYAQSTESAGNYDEAEKIFKKAQGIAEKYDNQRFVATVHSALGKLDTRRDEYDKAIEHYLKAIEIFKAKDEIIPQFGPYYKISGLYFNLSLYDKAKEYLEKASEIAEATDSDQRRGTVISGKTMILNAIVESFREKADTAIQNQSLLLDSLRIYTKKVIDISLQELDINRKNRNKGVVIKTLSRLTKSYIILQDFDNGLKYGLETEKKSIEIGGDNLLSESKLDLAIIFLKTEQPKRALSYALASLKIAKDKRIVANADNLLSEIYSKIGQHKKAYEHLMNYGEYQKKMTDLEKSKIIAESDGKFQKAQDREQILQQKNEILELATEKASAETQRNQMLGGGLLLSILGFFGFRLNRIRKDRNDKKEFAEALIFAQEEERKRIARDLHDGVGQSLLLMKKQMTLNHETTLENQQLITDTLEEVRSISRDLHPFQLEKFGLTAAIKDVILKVEKSTDLFITSEIDNIDKLLSEKAEINFYRTIQEALNNIVKHAAATGAKVIIQKTGNEIAVKIMDNGKGFDHELAIVKSKSLGLRTMFERVAAIGGKLKIGKNEQEGTVVEFKVPII